MANRRFIPETPEALTPEWLNEVLAPAERISDVQQQVLGEGEGFVGDILRLSLNDTSGHTSSLIAKLPKLENRAVGELLGAYEREIMFYQTLGKHLPVRSPELYYADFDRDKGSENQEVILRKADALPRWTNPITTRLGRWIAGAKKRRYILLIEDLASAEPGDQVAGADRGRCAAALREIARMHAAYWNAPELEAQFWLLPMDIDVNMRQRMAVDARQTFANVFPEANELLTPFLDEACERGIDMTRELASGPTTLLHYDLRLDNLMFDGDEIVFIDWQLVRRGNPAYDVAYFLSSAVTDDGSAGDLLQIYLQALVDQGITGYEQGQLEADYRKSLRVIAMGLSTVDQVNVGDGRGRALLEGWMMRLARRLLADR